MKKVKARFPKRETTLCLLLTFLVTSLLIGNAVFGPVKATSLQEEELSEAASLTSSNANDDLPASVVYNNTLCLFWESNRDQSKELYMKTFDGISWSTILRITENEAEDGGPAVVVYNGLLYLFWHSTRDDPRRDVYYKTYDGEQWSEAFVAVENGGEGIAAVDDFADVAVYNDKLYLAWTSGRTGYYDLYYKTFDGSSWSADVRLTDDADPDLHPALEAFDGKLFVQWHSYGYGADSWELLWKTFDGTEWSNISSITSNQAIDEGPGDLEVHQQNLYLSFSSDRDGDKEIYYTVYANGAWSNIERITDNPAMEWHSSLTVFNDTLFVFFQSNRESNNDIYYKIFGEAPPPTQPTLPTAEFTWTPYAPLINETVIFDASSSSEGWNGSQWEPIVSYQWDFGDNNVATGKIVSHTYAQVGRYIVRLNVTDSRDFWDTLTREIQVHNLSISDVSDWPMFHRDITHTGYSSDVGPVTASVLWSKGTGNTDERAYYSPVVAGGKVYTGSTAGTVYCFDAVSGETLWSFQTGGEIKSTPSVYEDLIFIGSNDNNIYCLSAVNGTMIWRYEMGGRVECAPTVFDGKVYVGSWDGNLYCLDMLTGEKIWEYNTGQINHSSPAISDGRVYVIGGYAYCLDGQNGTLIWKDSTPTDGNASPVLSDGLVFIAYSRPGWGRVDAFDAVTGEKEWSFTPDAAACSTPAIADNRLYFGSCDDRIYCLNATTGEKIWSYQADSYEIRSSPAVVGGLVYFIDDHLDRKSGKVYCLDAYSGSEVWVYPTGTMGGWSSPAVAYGIMFVGAGDKFFAFGEATQQGTSDIQLSLESSTTYVGFKVKIEGNLTNNNQALSGAPILLSYSVTGGDSWNEITLVYTTNEGKFAAIWMPSATGNYLVKASWAGNSTFPESNTVVSLSVIEVSEEKVFSVTSNSTLTQLAFNSTDRVLVFSVSGPSGTTGYVKATIPKDLLYAEGDWTVLVNEKAVTPTVNEDENNTYLYFTYEHGTKTIKIIGTEAIPEFPSWVILPLLLVATLVALVYKQRLAKHYSY